MILLTVGSQLPFDRLARAMDRWCESTGRTDVIGQIGEPGPDGYRPMRYRWSAFFPPSELQRILADAELIVAHAGMGSIITALTNSKPIVIMPRRASLGEHRNEHQLATASRFAARPGIFVAEDETKLADALEQAFRAPREAARIPRFADNQFTNAIRRYIFDGVI